MQNRGAAIVAGRERLVHDVDAMHAAHARLVVDVERVVVVEAQRARRAHRDDAVDREFAADSGDVGLHLFLVDLHVVAPGSDDGEVRAMDRVDAIVAASGKLELELVGQRRTMHFVEEFVDDRAVRLDFVVAGHFAARVSDAAHRGAQSRAGAAEVEADLVEFVEGLLHVFRGAALEHDVAALAVEGDQAGAVLLPDVAELAQQIGRVVKAGGRLHAQRMEFLRGGKFRRDFGEARNDAAAIAEHRYGAALPEAETFLVGMLELAEQVVHHRGVLLVAGVAQPLQAGDEARPRPGFELIQIRRRMTPGRLVALVIVRGLVIRHASPPCLNSPRNSLSGPQVFQRARLGPARRSSGKSVLCKSSYLS